MENDLIVMASMQEGEGKGPVTDQWLPPFVVVGDDNKPVGTIEVILCIQSC